MEKFAHCFLLIVALCRCTISNEVFPDDSGAFSDDSDLIVIDPDIEPEIPDLEPIIPDLPPIIPHSHSGNTELIFQTGFEPGCEVFNQTSKNAEIRGTDLSFQKLNRWKTDLEENPKIGYFDIQYQGGNSSQRLAEIVPDPQDPSNSTLKFWIKEPNVNKWTGRVQANIYENNDIKEFDYSVRLLIPSDFNNVKNAPFKIYWLTLMEFWNNASWGDEDYQYRMSVSLVKDGKETDSLRLRIKSQIRDNELDKWGKPELWKYVNDSYAVPIGKWMRIDIHFVEGDDKNGRFIFCITPDGEATTIVHDIRNFTHHPDDPSPDGMSHFNPLKLYTASEVVERVANSGGLLAVYWDDFQLSINK